MELRSVVVQVPSLAFRLGMCFMYNGPPAHCFPCVSDYLSNMYGNESIDRNNPLVHRNGCHNSVVLTWWNCSRQARKLLVYSGQLELISWVAFHGTWSTEEKDSLVNRHNTQVYLQKYLIINITVYWLVLNVNIAHYVHWILSGVCVERNARGCAWPPLLPPQPSDFFSHATRFLSLSDVFRMPRSANNRVVTARRSEGCSVQPPRLYRFSQTFIETCESCGLGATLHKAKLKPVGTFLWLKENV